MNEKIPVHLVAEIMFLPREKGGRKYIFSGYRGQMHYDGHDWDTIEYFEKEGMIPTGQIITVKINLFSPDAHRGKLFPGKEFELREGDRIIGYGKIINSFI